MFTLDQILGLVGTLDDSAGLDTPRERFRRFLHDSVGSTGAVRDYVEACATNKGTQYSNALQDLVNHIGDLIGFEVEYGRYKGVSNDIGHDGLWRWNGFSIVVEVKTTDAYTIKTETLLTYINKLISAGKITDSDHAMGLYVFARADSELKSLANSIIAEKRTQLLRIATVDSVLSLAEMVQEKYISAEEAVGLLRPGSVFVADAVQLLARIAAHAEDSTESGGQRGNGIVVKGDTIAPTAKETEPITLNEKPKYENTPTEKSVAGEQLHLMTPVRDEEDGTAEDTITRLLNAGWYVFGETTPFRKQLKPGDRICFYQTSVGVVAEAEVASTPERRPPSVKGIVKNLEKFPWSFRLTNTRLFFDNPIIINNPDLRAELDAFEGRDPSKPWSWFVQGTHKLTAHDFAVLTGRSAE